MSITIAVADDHADVREGLVRIPTEAPDLTVVGAAASGDELVGLILQGLRPAVALIDLQVPGGGLDLVARLHELRPELRLLVCSMHPQQQEAVRCLSAGASGYLGKGGPPEELIDAIRTVADGRRHVSGTAAGIVATSAID